MWVENALEKTLDVGQRVCLRVEMMREVGVLCSGCDKLRDVVYRRLDG